MISTKRNKLEPCSDEKVRKTFFHIYKKFKQYINNSGEHQRFVLRKYTDLRLYVTPNTLLLSL